MVKRFRRRSFAQLPLADSQDAGACAVPGPALDGPATPAEDTALHASPGRPGPSCLLPLSAKSLSQANPAGQDPQLEQSLRPPQFAPVPPFLRWGLQSLPAHFVPSCLQACSSADCPRHRQGRRISWDPAGLLLSRACLRRLCGQHLAALRGSLLLACQPCPRSLLFLPQCARVPCSTRPKPQLLALRACLLRPRLGSNCSFSFCIASSTTAICTRSWLPPNTWPSISLGCLLRTLRQYFLMHACTLRIFGPCVRQPVCLWTLLSWPTSSWPPLLAGKKTAMFINS